ncbi:F-box protein [Artemisia annua]|uniref:F-box protein n=1 Tax=Artemisia annua TaxID=35608 RepID=A0A2U1KX88_ARTAN|nr:F-box protein [Artemisia annua]
MSMCLAKSCSRMMRSRRTSLVNVQKALDLFLKGAARGSTLTMVDTGLVCWEIGKKDEGVRMYKRAAEHGDSVGQCNLGISYLQGKLASLSFF